MMAPERLVFRMITILGAPKNSKQDCDAANLAVC